MPTTIDNVHESVYRSYHILEVVKQLCERRTHPEVIREIIEVMESQPIEVERVQLEAESIKR